MSCAELWPPLALIRRGLAPDTPAVPPAGGAALQRSRPGAAQTPVPDAATLLLPLTELARRREAVAQRAFSARWAPGRLLSVLHEGRLLGVLLDHPEPGAPGAERWHGWLAAAEADWAGSFDLLLEPQDEPFDPLFGVVQTWNPVVLLQTPQLCARVQGALSATRLAAVRALAEACAASPDTAAGAAEARPGRIALRSVDGLSVLTGTPLAAQGDPRQDYQALYRQVAQQLAAAQCSAPVPRPAGGWAARLRQALAGLGAGGGQGQGLWRPAAAVLALVLVVQNAGLFLPGTAHDEARLRAPAGLPTEPLLSTAAPDLRVRWQAGTDMAAVAQLLQRADAQVIAGPDAEGVWSLRLLHPEEGRRVLQSSPQVQVLLP